MSRSARREDHGGDRRRISVIVPTLNEEHHIGSLLADLCRQSEPPMEVLVIDGGSEDETARVVGSGKWDVGDGARHTEVRFYSAPRGVGRQRNYGGRAASGEILVFLDADVRIAPGFLAAMGRSFGRRGLEVATPLYMPKDSTLTINAVHVVVNVMFAFLSRRNPSGSGQCIMIGREVFGESGGFDEGLQFDDAEFIHRVGARQGRRFGIIPRRLLVSDRRFREEGTLNVVAKLVRMSNCFRKGDWSGANAVEYQFGRHTR